MAGDRIFSSCGRLCCLTPEDLLVWCFPSLVGVENSLKDWAFRSLTSSKVNPESGDPPILSMFSLKTGEPGVPGFNLMRFWETGVSGCLCLLRGGVEATPGSSTFFKGVKTRFSNDGLILGRFGVLTSPCRECSLAVSCSAGESEACQQQAHLLVLSWQLP